MFQIDKPDQTGLLPLLVKEDDPPEVQVRLIVQSYNRAVQEVYGQHGRVGLPSGAKSSPLYDKLLAAARVLATHAIPPRSWAEWALKVGKSAQERRCVRPKPGYILAVFSAAYIEKRRGWFRKTSDHRYGNTLKIEDAHREQLYRRQESAKLARGFTAEGALLFLPPEYVEMRKTEISAGYADPMMLFPRARSVR